MKSMTGYSFCETDNEEIRISAELKSYNNRFLEINVNVPSCLQGVDNSIRKYLSDRIARGKIEFYLRIKEMKNDVSVEVDENVAMGYMRAFEKLREITGITEEITLSSIIRQDGVLKKREPDPALYEKYILPLLEKVCADYEATCIREGENTKTDILRHMAVIERNVAEVEAHSGEFESLIRKSIYDRFHELLGENVDESRVYAETAMLLMKYTINEELVRLRSHIEGFHATLESDKPAGKKLDFICQEMNREINTIGSKSMMVEIDQAVVDMKDALENIREQVRNVV